MMNLSAKIPYSRGRGIDYHHGHTFVCNLSKLLYFDIASSFEYDVKRRYFVSCVYARESKDAFKVDCGLEMDSSFGPVKVGGARPIYLAPNFVTRKQPKSEFPGLYCAIKTAVIYKYTLDKIRANAETNL